MKKEQIELKIKPLPIPPDKKKVSFRLPEPTLSEFEAYLAAYQEIYGVEPDRDFVADQIFTAFFESDRAFAAYQARGNAVATKKTDGAP